MIDRDHKLPLARQAKAVGISRGSIYYRPRPVGEAGLGLMRRIDELHLEYPFAGSRMMRGLLRQEGLPSGRRHIATLMRRMGIDALCRKPNTSRRRPGHTVYPYLLRGLEVSRPNQVWAMDITYIPMARGFVYLAAVMDWHSRKVLGLAGIGHNRHRLLRGGARRIPGDATARRRYSTQIREASSQVTPSPAC